MVTFFSEHSDDLLELKSTDVAFVGQRGNFQRVAAIVEASGRGFSIGPVRSGFSAPGVNQSLAAVEYVQALAHARFGLCPPGNYAGDSFRLGESLLLGCLPVEINVVISEPGRPTGQWTGHATVSGETWGEALARAESMTESARLSHLDSSRTAYLTALDRTRERLLGPVLDTGRVESAYRSERESERPHA